MKSELENIVTCAVCKGEGWVCEDHPDAPWDDYHQDNCGPGMPCECNKSDPPWRYGWTETIH